MQPRLDQTPIVRCPGCEQPMHPIERIPIPGLEPLVDVRYVCGSCGMETKRTIKEDA